MARLANRKAVSSPPAIANIDEQLDEVVMNKLMSALAILLGFDVKQVEEKEKERVILSELERDWRAHKAQRKILNNISILGR
ncbi:TPA: hypothetical protein ACIJX2_000193 [Serratia marcescens]